MEDVGDVEFKEIINELLWLSGATNPADFWPILRVVVRADVFLQNLIDEERDKIVSRWPADQKHGNICTIIQSLLSFQQSESEYYSDDIIKGHVLVTRVIVFCPKLRFNQRSINPGRELVGNILSYLIIFF